MKFQHRFDVRAPLAAVAEFHRRSASMGAITPPPVIVRIHSAPAVLQEGDLMEFTLWLGPLPIRWLARIEDVTPHGFVDRQISGPFSQWKHTHTFVANGESTTVHDQVEAEYSDKLFWKLVGMGMWLNLRLLFAFRGWKTRRLLEKETQTAAQQASQRD